MIGVRTMMRSMRMRMGCVLKLERFINVQCAPVGPLGAPLHVVNTKG